MLEKFQFMTLMFVGDLKAKRDEKGATAVEYGLMVALIAAAIVATVYALGGELNALFEDVTGDIQNRGGAGTGS